jgi:cell division ATPase FtsA
MIRYYEDRYDNKRKVTQVVTLGGGSNVIGLAEYLTDNLRLAVRSCDPWVYCDYKGLKPPARADKTMYATVMGLSLIAPKDLF